MTLDAVRRSGSPSSDNQNGTRTSPPAVSCHPVNVSRPTPSGRPHRLVNVMPRAMHSAPPTAARTPGASSGTAPLRTSSTTPGFHGAGQGVEGSDPVAEEESGEDHDEHGLGRHDHGGDAAGESVGSEEEQKVEGADVQNAQRRRAPPPDADGKPPAEGQQHQPAGQGPHGGRQERPVRWQQLGGDQVGAAPDRRSETGQGGRADVVLPARHLASGFRGSRRAPHSGAPEKPRSAGLAEVVGAEEASAVCGRHQSRAGGIDESNTCLSPDGSRFTMDPWSSSRCGT